MSSHRTQYLSAHRMVEAAIGQLTAEGLSDPQAAVFLARLALVHMFHTQGARAAAQIAYALADEAATEWGRAQ